MNYRTNKRILFDELGWVNPGKIIQMEDSPVVQQHLSRGNITLMEEAMPTPSAEDALPTTMTKTPWIYDPEDLEGYDLDTLNALIVEADSTVEPYETLEEAIAHLSMDHAEWQRLSSN